MGSKYNDVVITDSGTSIMAAAQAGSTITFTAVKTGNGTYDGTEDLESMTDLLSVKQSFGITGITVSSSDDSVAIVRSIASNKGLTTGYTITEIGLFATDPDTETEVLFAIITATEGAEDTMPPYSETPTAITFEIYISTENVSDGVVFEATEVEGTYVSTEDFNDYKEETDSNIEDLQETGLLPHIIADLDRSVDRIPGHLYLSTSETVVKCENSIPVGTYAAGTILEIIPSNPSTANYITRNGTYIYVSTGTTESTTHVFAAGFIRLQVQMVVTSSVIRISGVSEWETSEIYERTTFDDFMIEDYNENALMTLTGTE